MKKGIFVAVLCFAAIGLFSQPKASPSKNETPATHSTPTPTPPNSDHKSANDTEAAKSGPPHWYTSSEWWLVIIAALTGFAIAYQAREMVKTTEIIGKQADLMKSQTDILVEYNKATRDAADAAKQNAEFAQRSVEAMISKERARIRIEMDDLKLASPGDALPFDKITFNVFCEGTTPAYIVDADATPKVTDSEKPVDSKPHLPLGPLASVLHPSPTPIEIDCHIYDDLDDTKREAIKEGKGAFVHFYGKVIYKDVFDNIRETRFRYLWKVTNIPNLDGTRFSYWEKHGNAEDNRET